MIKQQFISEDDARFFDMLDSSGRIAFLEGNPEYVKDEYITKNKTYAQLREQWGISNGAVYKVIKYLGLNLIKIESKVTYCNEQKMSLDDPIFCYYLGLIATDGYIDIKNHRVVLQMSCQAKEVLEYLAKYFNVQNGIRVYHKENSGYNKRFTVYDLTIQQKKLLNILGSLGIAGNKEVVNRILSKKVLESLQDSNLAMYFRGIWDGDGTILYANAGSILEVRLDMIESIAYILELAGLSSADYTIKPVILQSQKTAFILSVPKGLSLRGLYAWMYSINIDCCIREKYNKYLRNIRR